MAGADIIELGVPFSDPIADGPVIQQAAERGLQSGTSLHKILESVRRLRATTQIPIVLMAYYNNIHAFGETEFCGKAVEAGVDGVIVPDMPPDEAGPIRGPADAGAPPDFPLGPTSTSSRRAYVAKESGGFVYYVSLTGITGAKLNDMAGFGRTSPRSRNIRRPRRRRIWCCDSGGCCNRCARRRRSHRRQRDCSSWENMGGWPTRSRSGELRAFP